MADVQSIAASLVERHGATDAARRVGCSRQMISAVAKGDRKPSDDLASAIERVGASTAPTAKAARVAALLEGPVLPELRRTVEQIDEALADASMRGTARAAMLRTRADTLHKIAQLQNEGEVTIAAIRRSRAWQELMAGVWRVLAKHPEAAKEVHDAVEAMARGQS